ncbi:MAG: 3-hydroxybutyryl-CoA dehydrogenase [Gemmatimonadaceae bacterium]|nr:3-hydroxybutyryl-CoA dehydrogenase [Gemmatimonadaceae bacterium]
MTLPAIGVVGAGAMGAGIAQVAAVHGHDVWLADAQSSALTKARASHAGVLARDVEKGRRTRAEADAVLARIRYVDGVDDARLQTLSTCGFVIEAIVEQLAAKQALLRALEAVVSPEAMLASNTSSLSIAALGGACTHAERVVGVHFFNPAPLMPLVEIIPAISTSPAVTDAAGHLARSWGKTTVTAKDTPGFLVNRVARPFYGESLRMLDEGMADAATIDWALTTLGGFRMGPFALMDMIGNDVNFAVSCSVYEHTFHDPRYRPSVTQQRMVEAGWLGKKSGRGYYRYDEGAAAPEAVTDSALGQAIVNRVLAMLVNEAVSAEEMGLASAADIETAMTKGVNYPRGLLSWGDQIGPANVLDELERLQREFGDPRYRPAPRLRMVARQPGGRLLDG